MEIDRLVMQAAAVWGSEELRDRRAELDGLIGGFGRRDAAASLTMADRVKLWNEGILAARKDGSQPAPQRG